MKTLLLVAALAQSGDPSGFVDQLNALRARYGLRAVAHDAAAVPIAAANNAWQAVRGLGHHVLGGYGQCAAIGMGSPEAALWAWCGSPAHAALILAPDLVSVGFAWDGSNATVATQQAGMSVSRQVTNQYAWTYYQWQPRRWRRWRR